MSTEHAGIEHSDPFAALGLPRRYDLERKAVELAHLRKLALLHPDRIADPVAREQAGHQMAAMNEAKTILLDDERRADALLRLLGGAAKESDRSLPEGFLVEIMDLRERMESAMAGGDPAAREEFEELAEGRRAVHRAAVAELFATILGEEAGDAEDAKRRIRLELNAWRYVERMREALRGEPPQ